MSRANANVQDIAFTQVTAGASAALIAANPNRWRVTIKNTDASTTAYIGSGTVTALNGFAIKAGESVSLDTGAAINVFSSGTPIIAVIEEF